ncbi:MAG: alpha/beta hydrolase [Firmicutes bacterium]|nr:alpha/beta hydrolase [Bacillota bacterium]
MKHFTIHTPFGELFASEECKDFAEFFIYNRPPRRRLTEEMTLQDLKVKDPNRNIESMCDGVNHLLETIRRGVPVVWDYWSEEEQAKNPEKKAGKLFYLPAGGVEKKPFVLICAGGGYSSVCSIVEGFNTARRINQLGYPAFVMNYRVGYEGLLPDPMEDVAQALKFIMGKAEEFGVLCEDYAVTGFSAGGHLCASWGTDNVGYAAYGLPKPGALFPVYPVIDLTPMAEHGGTFVRTLGGPDVAAAIEKYSVCRHVWEGYPPTFSVHCIDDPVVPYEQSLILQKELEDRGIAHAIKLGNVGGHGIGEGRGSDVEGWIDEAVVFWQKCIKGE